MFVNVIQMQYFEIFDEYWKDVTKYKEEKAAYKKMKELRNAAWSDGELGTKFRVVKRISQYKVNVQEL
ncbi:hypothetical protein B857_00940 [Solibacillus isronensis B3W22]|uniref:Uncharacterized protein n=1 Tax=Solibacillus isronensis B3W22 TaxID=1224748 RepID=K1KU30_9BACL|nr:hypothetical protein [Solibacillus isronensis]AMO84325.1 hypothetical protein SOLI23_01725 [Solibacillus silvestris]EKB46046.1 hypothetical protein B857_00940 [Solibacillus isronensis B3W22]